MHARTVSAFDFFTLPYSFPSSLHVVYASPTGYSWFDADPAAKVGGDLDVAIVCDFVDIFLCHACESLGWILGACPVCDVRDTWPLWLRRPATASVAAHLRSRDLGLPSELFDCSLYLFVVNDRVAMPELRGPALLATVTTLTSLGFLMIGYDNGLLGGLGLYNAVQTWNTLLRANSWYQNPPSKRRCLQWHVQSPQPDPDWNDRVHLQQYVLRPQWRVWEERLY